MSPSVMEFEDHALMQRLLDNLSEADTEILDELSISNDMLAMRLWDAENDLVDAYVLNELSLEDRQRFKSHYLTTPRRLRKLQFAQSLARFEHQRINVDPRARPKAAVPPRTSASRRWQMALAAAIVVAIAAGFALDDLRVRQQLASSSASLVDLTSQVKSGAQALDAQQKQVSVLAADTQRLENLIMQLRAASPAPDSTKPILVRIASFLLLPPKRGLEAPPVLAVPADAQEIEIRLLLEDNEFAHYRVSIKARGEAASLWQSPVLNAEPGSQSAFLKIDVPASTLKSGSYTIEVDGIARKGAQIVASYAVSVVGAK